MYTLYCEDKRKTYDVTRKTNIIKIGGKVNFYLIKGFKTNLNV